MKVTLLLPTLNEIDGMKEIIPRIKKEWYDQLIITDGGSTDGTVEFAKESGCLVHVQKEKGLRQSYEEAYHLVEGDVIITFTPDGNSIPELIPNLVEEMKKGYDMVIVSRYFEGAKSYDDGFITAFGNWLFTFLANILFRGKYTDTLVGFRAYRKELIKKLDLLHNQTSVVDRFLYDHTKLTSWEYLSVIRCARRRFKVSQIPGDEPPRIGGIKKSRHFMAGLMCLAELATEFFYWKR